MADARLLATPDALRALEGAHAVVFLVGGYDGSGDYGDIAQYEAAATLVSALGPRVVGVAVVEDACDDDHAARYDPRGAGPRGTVLARFASGAAAAGRDRAPFALPPAVRAAAVYLYGGGCLDAASGDRKLAMVAAVLDVLRRSGIPLCRAVASGQQVEREWLETLDPEQAALLGSLEPFGVRDAASAHAAARLSRAPLVTGDDAVGGLLDRIAAPRPTDRDGPLRANVHVSEWQPATADGDTLLDFSAAVLGALARPDGLAIQPVVARDDRQGPEHAAIERFEAACRAQGVEAAAFAEPLLLRAGAVDGGLARADITLSCSYHVALTSLLLGVPAALVPENGTYAQEAAGLLEDFGLPAAFAPGPGQDPEHAARLLRDGLVPARASIAHGAERVAARRLRAERHILGELTGALVTALAEARTGAPASQIEPDAALELARLRADHQALVREEREARERIAERDGQLSAERAAVAQERERAARLLAGAQEREAALEQALGRAQAAQREQEERREEAERRLAALLGSRSWRLTGIARSAARLIRRS